MSDRAIRIVVSGAVQGCGVRPALARFAIRHSWSGSVRNTTSGVDVRLMGLLPPDETLATLIREAIPMEATVQGLTFTTIPLFEQGVFRIAESTSSGPLTAPIPRDTVICDECLSDVRDVANRRYAYPFTSCAQCGPRYSLLISMPFDRQHTTMSSFGMCPPCREEYNDPSNRRYHAQTTCCPDCGPQVWLSNADGSHIAVRDDAICLAADAVACGKIVAIRGVGGYQLLADATSSTAVRELRRRKQRPAKPFAVLCRTIADAQTLAELNKTETCELQSSQNPIVLVRQRLGTRLARELNSGLSDIGLVLPTTALHDRLLELAGRPLICTSGNQDGEPLAFDVDESQSRLRNIADMFLHHDRKIVHSIDDSVVRVIANRPVTIRCARGIAPLPLVLATNRRYLALGGHHKSAFAVSNGRQSLLGPHRGDLDSLAARTEWCESLRQLQELAGASDDLADLDVMHDPHPGYFPTKWSEDIDANRHGVWHHHAHIVAGMLEQQWLHRRVLGVAFDGTGCGPDGSVWGGEFLLSTATNFQRVGHLRPFGLPGGEAAIKDLNRISVSLLNQLEGLSHDEICELLRISKIEQIRLQQVLRSKWTVRTTSCGRLFDAAACLILGQSLSSYEGQAAMNFEAACDPKAAGEYSFEIADGTLVEIDWRPAFTMIVADRRNGTAPGTMAMRFHRGLATAIQAVCGRWPELPVVLGGGVFQNRVLVELLVKQWPANGETLGLPGIIPPNDGGLAAGQLASFAES